MANREKKIKRFLGQKTSKKNEVPKIEWNMPKYFKSLGLAWYFERFYEKAILVILSTLGMWKMLEILTWIF